MDTNFAANRAAIEIRVLHKNLVWPARLTGLAISEKYFADSKFAWLTGRTYRSDKDEWVFNASFSNIGSPGEFRSRAVEKVAQLSSEVNGRDGANLPGRVVFRTTIWTTEGNHKFEA